jgi:hypothetical protein
MEEGRELTTAQLKDSACIALADKRTKENWVLTWDRVRVDVDELPYATTEGNPRDITIGRGLTLTLVGASEMIAVTLSERDMITLRDQLTAAINTTTEEPS